MMTQAEQIEQITPKLQRYWLANERIVVFKPTDTDRETVNAWFNITTETHQNWSADEAHYEIHDMRDATMNTYSSAKALELGNLYKDLHGRSAVIVADTHAGTFMAFFVNRILNRLNKSFDRRVFKDFQEGLDWVQDGLDTTN